MHNPGRSKTPTTARSAIARTELVLGGQKSGKSRRAEGLAANWLSRDASHQAFLIATAQAFDAEMQARIERHQADRLQRVPGMTTLEVPLLLADAILAHSQPQTLLVVDCLTLWLTNLLMPFQAPDMPGLVATEQIALLVNAVGQARGPVVLVGNEIGLGVIPLGHEVRAFVDALGNLNQTLAQNCERVTFMAAGLPLVLKEPA